MSASWAEVADPRGKSNMQNATAHVVNGQASRRSFLVASASGLVGAHVGLPGLSASAAATGGPTGRAKSTILFFLCGGASHIDTWDMKPDAPAEYRGPFKTVATSAPEIQLCEHLPLVAQQAHHLAIVRSINGTVNTNDHHAGYYHNLTGHVPDRTFLTLGNNRTPFPDDWPYMGSVVASRRPSHPDFPNAITLPHKPSRAPYTRPGQFAGRLGATYDPVYVHGQHDQPMQFQAPALVLAGDVDAQRLANRRQLMRQVDTARRDLEAVQKVQTFSRQQERALTMLSSSQTASAFDVTREPQDVRERYGNSVNAMSLLLARRLAQVGVPFITVFWFENTKLSDKCRSAGGWDTHGSNFSCLKDFLLPEFDRAFAALLSDLQDKNMLDETLVLVTSEMGRKPKIGDPRSGGLSGAGRDHWTHCLSTVLAGGGIRGGQAYGASDSRAEYPDQKPVTPAHIAKTVYRAMGIKDLHAQDQQGRPYHLLQRGTSLEELF